MLDRKAYISDVPNGTWPSSEDRYKRSRTEAEIAAAMRRRTLSSSSDEQEATPSPGRHVLHSGKGPIRDAPMGKKKRKAATPPCRERGISIRDSPPRQRRRYVHRSESEGEAGGNVGNEGDEEDFETLAARTARRVAAVCPQMQAREPTRRGRRAVEWP